MSNKPHGLVRGQERLPVQVACRSVPTADELASSLNRDDVWKIHKSSVLIHTIGWESERQPHLDKSCFVCVCVCVCVCVFVCVFVCVCVCARACMCV